MVKQKSLILSVMAILLLALTACQPFIDETAQPSNQLVSLQALPATIDLGPGEKEVFSLEAIYSDGSKQQIDSFSTDLQWESGKPASLSIDSGYIHVSDQAQSGEQVLVVFTYKGIDAEMIVDIKYALADTIITTADGLEVVTNYTDYDVLVNKQRNLPQEYAPADLIIPNISFPYSDVYEKMYMREEAAHALEALFASAKESGYQLQGISGYRSYKTQQRVFNYQVNKHGSEEEANKISARPGQSEHQTGLAMDISCSKVENLLEFEFGEIEEGKWVLEHCADYGFIIRYPLNKEDITGYSYEPWHLRYVGPVLAQKIMAEELTMEEYFIR